MNNQTPSLKWATNCLVSNGYSIERSPEIVLSTAWSTVIRFLTSRGNVYLKQTPPAIAGEAKIIQLLSEQFHASVPVVIAANEELHCFLMKDAGQPMRVVLKAKFSSDLLCQAIKQYAEIQRSAENSIESFIQLGVPDWRLDKLPTLYDQMISQEDFLIEDGLTDKDLQTLHDLKPKFSAQCISLSNYKVPETVGIPDFHDNNVLLDPNSNKLTFIDWGESVITHPFFSLNTMLQQTTTHHGIIEGSPTYLKLRDMCFENWSEVVTLNVGEDLFILVKQLYTFYSILGMYRLMNSVDLQAFKSYYATKPDSRRISGFFKKYIELSW